MKTSRRVPTLRIIADLVIKNYKIDIRAKGRNSELIKARWLYTKLARTHTFYSTEMIGGEIGKDHATILHYYKRIDSFTYFTKDLELLFILYSQELLVIRPDLVNTEVVTTLNRDDYTAIFSEFRKVIKKLKKTILELKSRRNIANKSAKSFRLKYEAEVLKNEILEEKLKNLT